jgi:hypothetical protein
VIMGETSTPSPNCRHKWVIKPRVWADHVMMDDSNCANSNCDNPKRPGKLIKCAGLGCQTKVHTHFVNVCLCFLMQWSLSFITHASPLVWKKEIGFAIMSVILTAAFTARDII